MKGPGMRRALLVAGLAGLAAVSLGVARCARQGGAQPPAPAAARAQPHGERPLEVPEGLDLSRRRPSDAHRFVVSLESFDQHLRIGRLHDWTVTVHDRSGRAVEDAAIGFHGGMPAHNHGFPTQPRVTGHLGRGTYLLEGVKFNMTGWWEFEFEIEAGGERDVARFNVVVAD
jgi:hypothetical protein